LTVESARVLVVGTKVAQLIAVITMLQDEIEAAGSPAGLRRCANGGAAGIVEAPRPALGRVAGQSAGSRQGANRPELHGAAWSHRHYRTGFLLQSLTSSSTTSSNIAASTGLSQLAQRDLGCLVSCRSPAQKKSCSTSFSPGGDREDDFDVTPGLQPDQPDQVMGQIQYPDRLSMSSSNTSATRPYCGLEHKLYRLRMVMK